MNRCCDADLCRRNIEAHNSGAGAYSRPVLESGVISAACVIRFGSRNVIKFLDAP